MASFFEDFEEKKKKNRKKVMQIVNPSSAVKTSKETKQATKTKTVTPAAKSYVSKNTKRNFAKDYENRKKVTLPSASNLPSLPSVKTSDGSLRTPIRSIREDRRQVENLAAQRQARAAQLDRQTLYEGDKTLNPVQQRAIQSYKLEWENAKARGDAAGMALAHQKAERLRRQMGFSAGKAGNEFISPEIAQADRELLNQSGQLAMKQAKLDYEMASRSGNTLLMKEAILEMAALRKGEQFRSLDIKTSAGTDAYGRPIQGISQREKLIGEAMGKAIPGSLLSLRETANAALRNQARQRWTADKTPEMVNPDALGQRLMRESMEAGARATQDQNAVEKFLTETAISMGQMIPGMAASAIPGVGPALGVAILSGQAAGAKAFELNERGITPNEALTRGLISGGIEAATESIPLARLGKILKGAGGKSLIKNVLGQMGIEGTEESIAYTLNYLADKAAQDPEAEWTLEELGRNALAGAVAGGALAGAGSLFTPNAQAQLDNARRAIEQNDAHGLVRDEYTNSQDQKVMDEIDEISKRLGLKVQFADQVAGGAANASIRGNVVTIERNNLNPVRFLYGHEVAHYMQEASPDAYTNFRAVIAQEKEVSARVEEIMAEGGLNWDQALDEVTADYAGTLIENERILQRFIQENQRNKPLLQKLADAFRGLLQKITGKDKAKVQNAVEALELALEETIKSNRLRTGREARIETRRANQTQRWQENRREDLIQKLIQDYQAGTLDETIKPQVDSLGIEGVVDAYLNGGKNPLLAAYEEGQTRYSFKRAGDTKQAEEMEAQGATRKTIWQATGQTRDAKGNWVEEVDDSGATFYPQGDAKRQGNPDWVRLKELESKMLAGTITQEELAEANNLAKNLRGLPKGSTLGDYLDHPELFQAVPGIEDTPFQMADIDVMGERSARGIAVSRDLPQDQRLSTTLHETQHELQHREGRPTGASTAYWKGRADADGFVRVVDQKTLQEASQALSQAFDALPPEILGKVREMNRADIQKDYDRALAIEEELMEGPHANVVQAYLDAKFDLRMASTPREMLPSEAYLNTAGEIEARETQKRMNMTAEERRETMPDLGWDRAVFTDDGVILSAEERTAIHNELLEKVDNNAQAMEEKGVLAELTGQEFTKGEQNLLQQVAEFFEQQGSQVEREGFGTVRLNKRGIKDSMAHGLGRKKAAAFAAVPEVIKNGVQIDYQPNWKGRSYDTYVIAGEVTIDGEPNTMGVVLIKRAEDSRYYLHEVMEKEKGAPASFQTGATAEAARLPGDAESPSNTSIPQTEGESNEKLSDKALSSYERAYEMVYKRPLEKPKTVQQAAEQASVGVIDRLQNLEPPKAESKVKPLPKPGERKVEAVQEDPIPAEDLAYMDELLDSAQDRDLEAEFQAARDLIPGGVTDKTSMREKGKDIGRYAYRKLVDSGDEIRKAGKQSGDKYLYFYYNQAKASTATAQNMIAMRQSDVNGKEVGESLVNIFGPIKKKGKEYFTDFQDYLLHRHNIQRMGTPEERQMQKQARRFLYDFEDMHPEYKDMTLPVLREASDGGDQIAKEYLEIRKEKEFWDSRVKPVFNYEMTPEKSQTRVKQYEASHPEFKELAQRVYQYNRNLMQYRVDSGLISQETADFLQKKYPNYVPTFHKQDGVSTAPQEKGTRVGKTVKKATGSTGDTPFIDMDKAIAQQTMSVVRESAKNRFGQRLLNKDISQDYIINVESLAQKKQLAEMHDEDGFLAEQTNKDNTFTVYQNGKAYEITMTPAMYEGVKSLSKTGESDKRAVKAIIGANNVYKKLITAWNPLFTVKNFLKDLQDALLYTGDAKAFAKNYPKALKQIFGKGDEWKLYQALGGTASSVYETEKGVQLPTDNMAAKMVGKVEFLNQAIEQAPRLAEFMATADKGNRTQEELMEAMYKAADITINFGRSGDVTKMLNSSFVPFLNPSIQGVDKLMRTVRDNPRAVGPWVGLVSKAAILGVAPAIINVALFGDEEDYDELNQRDKDNNFMFPLRLLNEEWDGMWFRFPRGRALAAMGAVANAGMNKAQGKDVDMIDLVTTVWGNIGVVNPMTSNIARPLVQTAILDPDNPGKTWYGGDIETQAMQNKKPGERYNEKTDIVSKFVGGKLGVSPAKINYLLDSYTGVVGDLALPLLTPTNPVGKNPLSKAFVTDSTTSNRLSGDFYDLGDQLKYAEQDGSTADTIAYNYWSKVSQDLSDVNEEIRKMENDLSLDSKAKRKKYRDLKAQANEIIRDGIANVEAFRKAAEPYADQINEDTEWDIFDKVAREVLGAEKALEYDGKTTYEKAQEVVKEGGSYDSYYDYLQNERALDKVLDAESNLATAMERGITGTTLTDAQNESDRLNKEYQDLLEKSLTGSNGWKPTRGDRELAVLESMNLPEEEAFAIWKMRILDEQQRWELKLLDEGGLPEMEYFRYKMAVKHMNGYEDPSEPGTTKRNSKKDMRVPIINSLDITPEQKDILYLDVENWAKSGLYKTPWH